MNGISLVQCVKKEPNLDTGHNLIVFGKDSQLSTQSKPLSKEDLVALDTVKKKAKCANDIVNIRTAPPPAVARRNARERNRVKQVNNGFANLRQHIPNSIASAFESGKNGNKKLSKVETLRMAVEYIRSLEELLELSNDLPNTTNKSNNTSYQSSLPLTSLDIESSSNYTASLASPLSDDDISNNSLSSPIQYVKISGHGDTFQLVPINILQNSQQFIKSEPDIKYKNVQLLNTPDNHISLSPEIYSENSLSPGAESDIQSLIPVFNVEQLSSTSIPIKIEDVSKLPNEEMRILCRNLIMLQGESQEVGKSLNINELISW